MKEEDIVMRWGKFKGQKMGDLPSWYLKWLAENVKEDTTDNTRICLAADKLYRQTLED